MATPFPNIQDLPKEIQREAQTLRDNRAKIMENVGKFVLIHGESIVDYFPSYGLAATKGYDLFGLKDFLVTEVRAHQTPVRAMRCGVIKADGKLRLSKARAR